MPSGPPAQYNPADSTAQAPYGAQPQYGAPPQGAAPQYGPAPEYGAPQYGAPGYGAPGYGAPGYGGPAQPEKGNGIGIAAIILAVLFWPVGFILGIVSLFKARTKALGVTAIVLSVVVGTLGVVLTVAALKAADKTVNDSASQAATPPVATQSSSPATIGGLDPSCTNVLNILTTSGQDLQAHQNSPSKVLDDLNIAIKGLNDEQSKATKPEVKTALGALIKDYTELRDDLKGRKAPSSDLTQRITQDATALGTACV
jgi:hypothetical protein